MKRRLQSIGLVVLLILMLGSTGRAWVRGYLCDCAGRMQWTQMDHCHGPHGEACPHEHEEKDPDQHHHEAWLESIHAQPVPSNDWAVEVTATGLLPRNGPRLDVSPLSVAPLIACVHRPPCTGCDPGLTAWTEQVRLLI